MPTTCGRGRTGSVTPWRDVQRGRDLVPSFPARSIVLPPPSFPLLTHHPHLRDLLSSDLASRLSLPQSSALAIPVSSAHRDASSDGTAISQQHPVDRRPCSRMCIIDKRGMYTFTCSRGEAAARKLMGPRPCRIPVEGWCLASAGRFPASLAAEERGVPSLLMPGSSSKCIALFSGHSAR